LKLRRMSSWMLVACAIALPLPNAQAQTALDGCGSLTNGYGPYDYRTEQGDKLKIVEDYHFTPEVEALVRGHSALIGADLDYTLRAYPNHHRALLAMLRLGRRTKLPLVQGARLPVECYFQRAIRFAPDDAIVRNFYSLYLYDNDRRNEAVAQLKEASVLGKDDAFTHYNIALVYIQHGDLDRALPEAQRAYQLGFPRSEVKDKLMAAGKWVEPPPLPASSPASGAASAPADAASAPATAASAAASGVQ
jgi:tetratricopeptide (TPR) repeat protein